MNRVHLWVCRSSYWARALETKLLPWALDGVDLGDDVLEVGPGPGLATDVLRASHGRMTSVEIDGPLARSLAERLRGTNVRVVRGDATRLPFPDATFSGAVSFTMLHHVPSPALQDLLLAEVCRVLKPGAVFAGSDSLSNFAFRLFHLYDTLVPVDPGTFGARLEAAGFVGGEVSTATRAFRFRARRP